MTETVHIGRAELAGDIAHLVVEKLSASVISSVIPVHIGKWICETTERGAFVYRHFIPMIGPTAMFADYRMNPDGTLNLELQDTNGQPFWSGTFRPVEVSDAHS